jgi:hypothetical protein
MRVTIQCRLIISVVLLITLAYPGNQLLFSQLQDLPSSPIPTETIKIVKPVTAQNVSTGDELITLGQSSDNSMKNCSVSVIVNDVRPYQIAVARGAGVTNDFSEWEFVLHTNYTQIIKGENKITSKLICPSALTRWYSILINGVRSFSNEDVFLPLRPEEQQNLPTTNLSQNEEIDGNDNELLISIFPEKNAAARGDTQNTTITVTNSDSRALANAEIDGKLIYPGDN